MDASDFFIQNRRKYYEEVLKRFWSPKITRTPNTVALLFGRAPAPHADLRAVFLNMACEGSFRPITGQGVLFDVPRLILKHKNLHSTKIEEVDFFQRKTQFENRAPGRYLTRF